ncbi:MAG: DUF2147 domain-containing protein [Afipia sp.]|nr:DUF2147 domain-containing protein [Afipia sp.]
MIWNFLRVFILIFALNGISAAGAQDASPSGLWLTQKGDARIQVSSCGSGICGKVVWLKDTIDPQTGKPQVDDKNPNPALRSRSMIGVQLFIGMTSNGPGSWIGKIYNADDGGTYDSKVKMISASQMNVEGCLGAFCGGEIWTKLGGR